MKICPAEVFSLDTIILTMLVLPAPLAPTKPKVCFLRTRRKEAHIEDKMVRIFIWGNSYSSMRIDTPLMAITLP